MASNPGHIPAGGKEKISVVVHTKNRGGSYLNKKFAVYTNDPKMAHINLTVAGKVQGYVDYSPKYIRFSGKTGQSLNQTIQIRPYTAFPFKIKKVTFKEGKYLRHELKPLPLKDGPKGYQVIVYNTMDTVGRYNDNIIIETDLKEKSELKIPVSGRIRDASPQAKKTTPDESR